MAQQFQPNLRWDLITLIACEVYECWELDRRKRFLLVPTLTEAPSETISYLVGLTGAAGPTRVSSSRLTAAGIRNSGWCRGRADGQAYCTGRRFRGQRAKIDKKSSSAHFAAHGINFHYWNGRASPQVTLSGWDPSHQSRFQIRYPFGMCAFFSSFFFSLLQKSYYKYDETF